MRSAQLLASVAASAITAHLGEGGGPVDPPTGMLTTAFDDISANLTPVAGWGALKRNPDYAGPCCRVADLDSAAETDLDFDEYGLLTAGSPYTNTRVIKIYDQWGSDDLVCDESDVITLASQRSDTNCRFFHSAKTDGFLSTLATDTGAAWALTEPLWVASVVRQENSGLQGIWSVDKGSGYMSMGLWQEYGDLHWRVNGSGPSDWTGTNWTSQAADVQDVPGNAIGDMTQGDSNAYAYFNGTLAQTKAYTAPITYDTGVKLKFLKGALSTNFLGGMFELHIFDKVAAASTTDISNLNAALDEHSSNIGVPKPNQVSVFKRTSVFRANLNKVSAVKRTTVFREP